MGRFSKYDSKGKHKSVKVRSLRFSINWFWSGPTWEDTIQSITVMEESTQPIPSGSWAKRHYLHSCGGSQWAAAESCGFWDQLPGARAGCWLLLLRKFQQITLPSCWPAFPTSNGILMVSVTIKGESKTITVQSRGHESHCLVKTPAGYVPPSFRFQVTAYHKIYSQLWLIPIFFSK